MPSQSAQLNVLRNSMSNHVIIIMFKLLPTPPDILIKYLFITVLITAIPKNTLNKSLLNV